MNQVQLVKKNAAENRKSSNVIADITVISGMETRDHNKNGVSPKNQRSRSNILKSLFTLAIAFITTTAVSAQKLTGDISPLKTQKEVNVVIDFSGKTVNDNPEEKYISEETKDKTQEEKEQWISEWNEKIPVEAFPALIKDLNEETSKLGITFGNYPNAEYTIKIKVLNIEPGHFAGPFSRPAVIKAMVSFHKKGETNSFASVEIERRAKEKIVMPYFVHRIAASFGQLGEELGSVIFKKLKK